MKINWFNMIKDADRGQFSARGAFVQIGRAADNDIVLDSPAVAEHAAVLEAVEDGWRVVMLEGSSIEVGDEQVYAGEHRPLTPGRPVRLFPYTLTLNADEIDNDAPVANFLDERMSELVRRIHIDLLNDDEKLLSQIQRCLDSPDRERSPAKWRAELFESIALLESDLEALAARHNLRGADSRRLLDHLTAHCVRGALLSSLVAASDEEADHVLVDDDAWSELQTTHPSRETELDQLLNHIVEQLGVGRSRDLSGRIDIVENGFWKLWSKLSPRIHVDFEEYLALRYLKRQIKDTLFGYGPLEDLLRLPAISEIMVVSRDRIYVERNGVLEITGRRFISDAVTESIISRIVGRVSRRIDRSQPLVDARLEDGSRVNAVIHPLAVSGPCLTIRKFPNRKLGVNDLIRKGAFTRTIADFLRAAVVNRRNILVSGGTGTGKTTLLNCLSDFIPDKERIVTIEDTAELRLAKMHVVRLETKQANVEGAGAYSIRDLVKNSLRMRPDRIVVGECRGGEALDMLQAMNTGHDGSLTTIHANSASDAILRLEVLVQMAADLPIISIHRQIASAIDLIVQLRRYSSGRRCVCQVTEVVGMNPEGEGLELRDLFLLDADARDSELIRPTGHLPSFMDELLEKGLLDLESFYFDAAEALSS